MGDSDFIDFPLVIYVGTNDNSWVLGVDQNRIGEGPLINGRPYSPYFTPSESMLRAVTGQLPALGWQLPDLVDAWGQPIVYVRRARPSGPLTGHDTDASFVQPQFYLNSMWPYTTVEADPGDQKRNGLGRMKTDQLCTSILNRAGDPDATFAQILRHPSLGSFGDPDPIASALAGTAQGGYILFSSGPDGIYFSQEDGPGTPQVPVDDIVTGGLYSNPTIVKEYDDIRVFGGG